ncbi:MAG: cytochrome c-type biogenesis protein, partial [Gemmatimonadota bacterium]
PWSRALAGRALAGLRTLAGLFALAGLVAPAPAIAQQEGETRASASRSGLSDAEIDQLTARVAAQLRCPVCRNQSVLESSAELSRQMQSLIRERLAAGDSPEEVKAFFVQRYGEWILLQPEPEGVNLLVYVLPALVLLGGLAWLVRVITRWSRRPATDAAAPDRAAPLPHGPVVSDEDRAWIEEAIRSD